MKHKYPEIPDGYERLTPSDDQTILAGDMYWYTEHQRTWGIITAQSEHDNHTLGIGWDYYTNMKDSYIVIRKSPYLATLQVADPGDLT